MKRRIRSAALAAALLFSTVLTGCERQTAEYSMQVTSLFDTVITLKAYAGSRQAFDEWADEACALLEEYHRLFDIYHEYEGMNNLCTVNRIGSQAPVPVDARILDLLELAAGVGEQTGGKVNVAMGSVLTLWSGYREQGNADPSAAALPSAEELQDAMQHIDPDDIRIDREASAIYLADPALQIDVGAVGKGYAVEQTARHMEEKAEEYGVTGALINAGGNLCCIGGKGDGEPWVAGVQDPADPNRLLARVKMDGTLALVTSGDYQRYYEVDGVRYAHIIDPDTGMPPRYVSSVSVLCSDSGRADALSTALFCLPVEEGQALVESLPGTEALWVEPDGRITYSSGFETYLLD